jgi:ATP-dependent RNA helicase DDX3X
MFNGMLSQEQREYSLGWFQAGNNRCLIATEIGSRGLNIPGVTHVVNYEMPNDMDVHLNRIGRTARGTTTGVFISLMTGEDSFMAKKLVDTLRSTQQDVPPWLQGLAE